MSEPNVPAGGTDPMAAFDAAQAKLDSIMAEAKANSARAAQVTEKARTEQATARSPRGEVTVTAKVGGVIANITFADAALELSGDALARLTVTTIAQAQHAAMVRFAEAASDGFGPDSPLAHGLRADAERAFPPPSGQGIQY